MSSTDLTTRRPAALQQLLPLAKAGQLADVVAARHTFASYRRRIADETRRRQDADLELFASYLRTAGVEVPADLATEPAAWAGVTWGLVEAYQEWMLAEGYAIGSVNVRLSTVKRYSGLATRAGVLTPEAYALIRLVAPLRHAEGRRIDTQREQTRKGSKKALAVEISADQATQLKQLADLRDRLLFCLLLDHGLRCGEVALLTVKHFDLRRRQLRFYRPKVAKEQRHALSVDTLAAAQVYFDAVELDVTEVLFGCTRAIAARVRKHGKTVGLQGLSPHDCRHYWAGAAVAGGTDIKALQTAGGWSSVAMPVRYVADAEVANEGVRLAS